MSLNLTDLRRFRLIPVTPDEWPARGYKGVQIHPKARCCVLACDRQRQTAQSFYCRSCSQERQRIKLRRQWYKAMPDERKARQDPARLRYPQEKPPSSYLTNGTRKFPERIPEIDGKPFVRIDVEQSIADSRAALTALDARRRQRLACSP